MKIVIATIKSWNIANAIRLKEKFSGIHDVTIFTKKDELDVSSISKINPDYIFFPHWSSIVPPEIFSNWNCVLFHMADLPYGRGGSPLQNLIVRGHKKTKITALKMTEVIDGGPVYYKYPLDLSGSAQDILIRCSNIIFTTIIPRFFDENVRATPQEGEIVEFKRRKPADGRLTTNMDIETIYDYIRMLDAEGYPKAYLEFGDMKLEFDTASLIPNENKLNAHVSFICNSERLE